MACDIGTIVTPPDIATLTNGPIGELFASCETGVADDYEGCE